jgi:DNA-binding NarL/FixJ family response regulator
VLIYSAYTDGVLASAAVVAEADAIFSKGRLGSELCETIRNVARGLQLLPPIPEWLGDALRRRLDHQEQAIFGLLLAGIKTPEIADRLDLPEAALESRLWSMLQKLEAVDPSNGHAAVAGHHSNGRVLSR